MMDSTSETAVSGITGSTSSGALSSVMRWSAPELQFDPDSSELAVESCVPTYESDVWAFGVTAWEVVTRRVPFGRETSLPSARARQLAAQSSGVTMQRFRFGEAELESHSDVARRVLTGETPSTQWGWPADVPHDIVDLVRRCWSAASGERPRMDAIVTALSTALSACGASTQRGAVPVPALLKEMDVHDCAEVK